jgi:hypothetical protein
MSNKATSIVVCLDRSICLLGRVWCVWSALVWSICLVRSGPVWSPSNACGLPSQACRLAKQLKQTKPECKSTNHCYWGGGVKIPPALKTGGQTKTSKPTEIRFFTSYWFLQPHPRNQELRRPTIYVYCRASGLTNMMTVHSRPLKWKTPHQIYFMSR